MKEISIKSKIVGRAVDSTTQSKGGTMPVDMSAYLPKSIWEKVFKLVTDEAGNEHLFSNLPFASKYGITMFADDGSVSLPDIYRGLPIDGVTLVRDDNGVLKVNPDIELGVVDAEYVDARINSLINGAPAAYDTLKEIADVLQGNVNSIGDILAALGNKADKATTLLGYGITDAVTLGTDQDILGLKNFTKGLQIDGLGITKLQDDVIYLDANLVVRGGITMYGIDSVDVPTIMDAIATDNVNLKVVDGVLTFVGASGGLSEVHWDDVIGRPTLLSSFTNDVGYIDQKGEYSLSPAIGIGDVSIPAAGSFYYSTGATSNGSLNDKRSFIGSGYNETTGKWYNLISVRHRNGVSDGDKFGLYIMSRMDGSGDLEWNAQTNGEWRGERVILDSVNWSYYIQVQGGGSFISTSGGRISNSATGLFINRTTEGTNPHITFEVSGNSVGDLGVAAHGEPAFYSYGLTGSSGWKRILYDGASAFSLSNITIYQDKWANGLMLKRQVASGGAGISSYNYDTLLGTFGVNGSKYFEFSNNLNSMVFSVSPNGDGLFYGGITMYSDRRKKTILNNVELTLQQIADAPLIQHYYNSDNNKTTHVGSIAQYWAGLNDWFCKLDNEGFYTMEIQNAALASAISIARELQRYESKTDKKIRLLKVRIGELEDKIEEFKKKGA